LLTDFHVHLRPDSFPSDASEYFTGANAERYREAAAQRGIELLGVAEHVHRFTQSLDVWRHPWWERNALDDLDEYCEFIRDETDLKLGIEADFVAGREDRMANLLDAREWDYVVGSVHFLRDAAVDMDEWDVWTTGDPDKIWRQYFETLGEAARTGMYDILAHPDLVKVWGKERQRPDGDLRRFYELAMDGIAESDVAIEVSTAGLRKPVGEIYPAREFLEMCLEAGRPVSLSSDAHVPEQLGYEYDKAIEFLISLGITEIANFNGRQRHMVPLG
jgi:histidinol-phosphatase (PHP family)